MEEIAEIYLSLILLPWILEETYSCSPFGVYGVEVCYSGHFGNAKTCNISTKCSNDGDGGFYGSRTEGGFWEVLLAI